MNQETTVKKTVSNLESGNVCLAGYIRRGIDWRDTNRFVGFKVGDCFYSSLKLLKAHFGVRNLKELEFETERLELGTVTAEWYNTDENYFWASYLWNGAFRVGSSCDKLSLQSA